MYGAYYTAPNMKLVVCSTDSLDALQATVAKTFMHVRTASEATAVTSQDASSSSGGKKKKKKKKANSSGGGDGTFPEDSSSATASSTSDGNVMFTSSSKNDGVWPAPAPLNFSQLIGGSGDGRDGDSVKVHMLQPVRDVNELRLVWGLASEQLSKWKGKASEIVRKRVGKNSFVHAWVCWSRSAWLKTRVLSTRNS